MIFIIGGGRLGNQIFQYAFVKKIAPDKEIIIGANFENLVELFDLEDKFILVPNRKVFKYIIWKVIRPMFKIFKYITLFDYYEQKMIKINSRYTHNNEYLYKRGIFSNIKFIYFGYFQSEVFFNKEIKNKLKIKQKYITKAYEFINPYKDKELIFIHVRRGDYVGLDGALPLNYYKNSIKYFNNKLKDPFYIFLTDDSKFVKEEFSYIKNKIVSENSLYVDFSIMTVCEYGVISNSTFSYWAAYLMKNRKEVLFPKYWLGFKEKRYSPIGIQLSWAKEMEF